MIQRLKTHKVSASQHYEFFLSQALALKFVREKATIMMLIITYEEENTELASLLENLHKLTMNLTQHGKNFEEVFKKSQQFYEMMVQQEDLANCGPFTLATLLSFFETKKQETQTRKQSITPRGYNVRSSKSPANRFNSP